MQYVKLGKTGLDVSRICVGCMGFGDVNKWHHPWILGASDAEVVYRHSIEKGVNFFDTANIYGHGTSEEIIGNTLMKMVPRDELVIATKVFVPMSDKPNGGGLSRKAILQEIDNSLRRLQTDYVDLYQIHRWDYKTPIEETMEALNDIVRAGKVRYIGASAMFAWQFQKALFASEKHGWAKFVSMQNHLNLIYREEEREMIPLCVDAGIGQIPYSPLAGGKLSRAWTPESSLRSRTDSFLNTKYGASAALDQPIMDRVGEVAAKLGVSHAEVALAWVLQKPNVSAPIIGPTTVEHVDTAIKALDVTLSTEDIQYLEELYVPHKVVGAI